MPETYDADDSVIITRGEVESLDEVIENMHKEMEMELRRKKQFSIGFDEVDDDIDIDAEQIVKELEGETEEESEISFLEEDTLFVVGK